MSRLLAVGPLVWLGMASYSLYLWHLPVLMFFQYSLLREPRPGELALAGALTVFLATTSWALIEQPVRTRRVLRSTRSFVYAASIAAVLLLSAGTVLWHSDGFSSRMPPEVQRYTSKENSYAPRAVACFPFTDAAIRAGNLCRLGTQDSTRPKVLIWGDSHALSMMHAYEDYATREHFALYFGAHSSCRPFLGTTVNEGALAVSAACTSFNEAMTQAIHRIDPDIVVLNAFWMYTGSRSLLASDPAARGRGQAFEAALERTVRQIGRPGRRVCVVQDSPVLPWRVPFALSIARIRGIDKESLRMTRAAADAQQPDIDAAIDRLAARGLITAVNLRTQLCNEKVCPLEHDGWPLYLDDNHLAREGARVASPALDRCFQAAAGRGVK